jgi:hypothetical protein
MAAFFCLPSDKKWTLLFQLLADFGLEAHCRAPGEKKESKTLVVFAAKPQRCYKDYEKLVLHGADHGADLSDVGVGGGSTIHVAESAKYLGSIVHRRPSGLDRPDVISRITSAKGAFAVLKKCLFSRKDVTYEGKRNVYEGLVLAILLYSSECWCLREEEMELLRVFHYSYVRTMCRISMYHVKQYNITNQSTLDRVGLQTIDTYIPCTAAAAVAGACAADGLVGEFVVVIIYLFISRILVVVSGDGGVW